MFHMIVIFINKTATRILEISESWDYLSILENYQDYICSKEKEKASLTSSTLPPFLLIQNPNSNWKHQQKEEQAKQRKKENRLKKVEEQITELKRTQERTFQKLCILT